MGKWKIKRGISLQVDDQGKPVGLVHGAAEERLDIVWYSRNSSGASRLLSPDGETISDKKQGTAIGYEDTVMVGVDYPTLEAAIRSLAGINRNKKIILPAGTNTEYNYYMTSYDMSNIIIEGAAPLNVSITSVQSCTQVSGYSHDIVLNVSSASIGNCAVDDIIAIRSTSGGTNNEQLLGTHKITNVDTSANRITVRSNVNPTYKPSGAITSTAYLYKTRIQNRIECSGMIGLFNIAMLDTLSINPGGSFGIGVSNLNLCFYGANAFFEAGNGSHIESDGMTFGLLNGATAFGAIYNAFGHCDGMVIGNCDGTQQAITCYGGTSFSMWYTKVVNASVGIYVTDLSRVQAANSKFFDCVTAGIMADYCSQVTSTGTEYTRCAANTIPLANAFSADGSFIKS